MVAQTTIKFILICAGKSETNRNYRSCSILLDYSYASESVDKTRFVHRVVSPILPYFWLIHKTAGHIRFILCVIFWTVVFIFIVVSCNITFQPQYPPSFLRCPLFFLGMEMIQPEKLFLYFDCWSNKAFENYDNVIQIMMSLLFFYVYQSKKHHKKFRWKRYEMNSKRKIQWH